MESLRVDEQYYINHNTDYSAFADAVMDVGPSPCEKSEIASHCANGKRSYVTVMNNTANSHKADSLKPIGFLRKFLNTALPCAWVNNIGNHIDHRVEKHIEGRGDCNKGHE